jgi:2-amino-4-hydroxy-6-hydroxymethyldihydropteridine diphosphokinase
LRVAIGLGSSLGDRRRRLELCVRKLNSHPALQLVRLSRWYKSTPLKGGEARGWFLNGVALFQSDIEPISLLAYCRSLEERASRRRARHWGDRTLDLDVLLTEGFVSNDPHLTLPHPAITQRPFVLFPLLEVWPDARDEHLGVAMADVPPPPRPWPWTVGVAARVNMLYLDEPTRS